VWSRLPKDTLVPAASICSALTAAWRPADDARHKRSVAASEENNFTWWGRLWGLSTRPRDRVQNGESPRYKSWANFLRQNQYRFCERVQSQEGNAGQWWQWCVTAEFTNSGIGISEVRSLPGLDTTGLATSPLTFPGGLACHGRSNQLVGGNVMSLLTGGEQATYCSWEWFQSRPHRVNFWESGFGPELIWIN